MASFDVLAAARELVGAGMGRRQADAVAGICRDASAANRSDLVTKADLAAGLSSLEARLTSRMVLIAVAVNGAFAAVIVGLLVAVLDRLP